MIQINHLKTSNLMALNSYYEKKHFFENELDIFLWKLGEKKLFLVPFLLNGDLTLLFKLGSIL